MEFDKGFTTGRLHICASMESKEGPWGRFGGGWNWKLGIQAGGNTVVISVVVIELTISITKKGA